MNKENTAAEVIEPDAMSELVLLNKVKGLFPELGNRNLGSPEAPTKAGFLALAREGKDIWNTWRKTYPKPMPDFSGLDFRKQPIDFSGYSFAGGLWDGDEETLIPCVDFSRCLFGSKTRFDGAQFGNSADLTDVHFGEEISFKGAKFGDRAMFLGAQFGYSANFDGGQFGARVGFDGAQFGARASFDGVEFGVGAVFDAWDSARLQHWWRALMDDEAVGVRMTFAEKWGISSEAFLPISFTGVKFAGDVSFQRRKFLGNINFGPTQHRISFITPEGEQFIPKGQSACFRGVPHFHGCTLYQDTSFDGAEFLAQPSAEAARAYRTLKLAFAQQHAIREEQRFFKLEMQAETGIATGPRRLLYKAYEDLSDYGFSLKRPFKFWLACLIFFAVYNGLLAASRVLLPSTNWARISDLAQYTLLNAAPLPGFEKKLDGLRIVLFPTDALTQLTVTIMEISHKSLSLVAFFLVGLALRNLFKMKG